MHRFLWCGLLCYFLAVGHLRAAENEPKVITLSCDGTLTPTYGSNEPAAPQPLQKTGVVVNLEEQTVFFLGYVIPILDVDEASINYGGRQIVDYGFSIGITGHIDRPSGRMDVRTMISDPTKQPTTLTPLRSTMTWFASRACSEGGLDPRAAVTVGETHV
jgi:hypothetical protein